MARTSHLLVLTLWSLLVPALSARAESTASKRVVAVLYFDNNTGDASLDVLQKGFADMMVTDLSTVKELQLVEREKLQQILDEQKLQRSKYFDAKTTVRIGQLVGAQYTVAGSFLAMAPQLRINIRLVENKSGNVILGEQVTGLKDRLFDLQQQLVNKFLTGLELKLPQAPRLRSRTPDVDTLLSYSKGLDLADQGKLQEASQQLATVVSKAPTFLLARERHEQILARLKAAEARRTEALSDVHTTLGQRAEQFLESHRQSELDEAGSSMLLGYRQLRMLSLLHALRPHLAPKYPGVILPGHESQALALMQQWREQARAYLQECSEHFRRFHTVVNGISYSPNSSLTLQPEDENLLRQTKYGYLRYDDDAALTVAEFLLMGRFREGSDLSQMGPTLADQDPTALKEGFQLLDQALQESERMKPSDQERRVRQVLELHGNALMLRGRTEEAIAKWQLFLDRFPTSNFFQSISNKIKTALGVGPNARDNAGTQYSQALADCDERGIREGYGHEQNRRLITQGAKAAREMFLELDKQCGQEPKAVYVLRNHLISTAMTSANLGDCATFHEFAPRYLELGGSKSDLAGYLKNYIPQCLPPGDGGSAPTEP
ncbi:CsgG/HfaB family protein [Hyalangium versicolor]|uniref:CsgG/HfaB family protein n=1 Tax=Hyalangium versicolor TaxID=2861190 RepID=UPI001CCA3FB8|nr:CsgG/HfaB family protein [Hyalangium versicolor]